MPDEQVEAITELAARIVEDPHDYEVHHADADRVLIDCIRRLAQQIDNTEPIMDRMVPACEALIAKFEALPKWYA